MKTSDFYYDLPEELIAQDPLEDRSSSRLLVLDKKTGATSHHIFREIKDYLKPGDCLVINDTKVIPARLYGHKEETGALIEILLLKRRENDIWECLVKPGKKARPGAKITFGDGILKGAYAPDVDPNNHVTMLRDLNCTFKGATVRNKDWDNGLIWAQSYSTRSFFIPAMQTVFDDDTSVLNSLLNVLIAVECQKVCFRTWRSLVGRTDLTKEQYIKRSNQLITENTTGRFDNRVQIVPDTYYTKQDEQRGYSNHATIHMYANNMPTSTSFTVESHRMEDLNNG